MINTESNASESNHIGSNKISRNMNGLLKDRHSLDQIIDDEQTQTLKIIKEEERIIPDKEQAKIEEFAVYK